MTFIHSGVVEFCVKYLKDSCRNKKRERENVKREKRKKNGKARKKYGIIMKNSV